MQLGLIPDYPKDRLAVLLPCGIIRPFHHLRIAGNLALLGNRLGHQIHRGVKPVHRRRDKYQAFIPKIFSFKMNKLMLEDIRQFIGGEMLCGQ